jgi:transcriptional regulator with XRE-family HTH domain
MSRRAVAGPECLRFGREFAVLRRAHGITQSDIARRMAEIPGYEGWSRVTVSDIERGQRRVDLDEAALLMAFSKEWPEKWGGVMEERPRGWRR